MSLRQQCHLRATLHCFVPPVRRCCLPTGICQLHVIHILSRADANSEDTPYGYTGSDLLQWFQRFSEFGRFVHLLFVPSSRAGAGPATHLLCGGRLLGEVAVMSWKASCLVAGPVRAWESCCRAEFAIRMERTWMHAVLPAAMRNECSGLTPF